MIGQMDEMMLHDVLYYIEDALVCGLKNRYLILNAMLL
jgi:hypothetical protein